MQCYDAIRARRSVRKYQKGAVIPAEHVKTILEAAMMAPSAVETASLAIVVCGRPDLQPRHNYWPQDCGAAIENILLQALDLGYGTCWCGCYPTEPRTSLVKEVLGCEGIPVAIVAVGKAAESPAAKGFYDETRVKYF